MKPPRTPQCAEVPSFPTRPSNRASLPHIGYRIGTYSDVRASLLYALDRDLTLASWTHREADDPGIALLEGAAIVTDILTFYQELYANEAFLRTARWRESVVDLVKLTGYRVAPAVGGRARFSLQVRGDAPVKVPAGFGIKADLAKVPDTANFETTSAIVAQPAFNQFHLFAPLDTQLCAPGATAFRAPATLSLKSGDKLLVGDGSLGAPSSIDVSEVVVVDQVRQRNGETLFTIKGALRRNDWYDHDSTSLAAFKLGRTFKHFGHNAPPQATTAETDASGHVTGTHAYDVGFDLNVGDTSSIPLDAPVDDLAIGSLLAVRAEEQRWGFINASFANVRRIAASARTAFYWGNVTGATTMLSLDSALDGGFWFDTFDIRQLELYEIVDAFTMRAQGTPTATPRGRTVYFFGLPAQATALQNVSLAFVKPGADSYFRTVVAVPDLSGVDPATPRMTALTLDDAVDYADFDNDAPATTVYGNLVDATEGKTQPSAILGNGDARATFQTFRVPKAPLTYTMEAGATPPQQPEIHVFVGERQWRQVAALYGRGPADEVYVVRQDATGDSWVQFGDGITGARLPSGVDNVTAVWRVGAGAWGPMKPATDPALGGRLDGLKGVKLPDIVTGGAPREDAAHAREAAPGKLQSLGRLVSIDDFASEALGIGGVVRARAGWELIGGVPGIVVTILMAAGREHEADAVRATLAKYNRCRGPQRAPIMVRQAQFEYVFVDATVALDARFKQDDVLVAIRRALGVNGEEANGVDGAGGLFDLAGRALGQSEYASRIEGIIQDVEGVVWTEVTALGSLGVASDPLSLPLPSEPRARAAVLHAANDRIFRLYSRATDDPNANALNLTLAASPPGACDG